MATTKIIYQMIVYTNGENYYGEVPAETRLAELREFGKGMKQRYMYKGYRRRGGQTQPVVVFDTKSWSNDEIARRKTNGFLGIRVYKIASHLKDDRWRLASG